MTSESYSLGRGESSDLFRFQLDSFLKMDSPPRYAASLEAGKCAKTNILCLFPYNLVSPHIEKPHSFLI